MMDSQEKDLVQAEVIATEETAQEQTAPRKYESKQEVIDRLKEIASSEDAPQKEEIDLLKTVFYKLHFAEREQQMKDYLEAGGDPDKYIVTPDELEAEFKSQMAVVKEKRQKLFLEQEAEKQKNLEAKLAIIEKIKSMITSPEEAGKTYQDFRQLQQEWKEIGQVPAEKASELWRSYQLYVEQYYDLFKLNIEAREYDFKKNLEIKEKLIAMAEKLADEEDVISAFHQLQELHQQFRETGPVAKDIREDVWTRFKAASTVINKRHQQHFEDIRAREEENLARKTTLCEKVEAMDKEAKTAAEWETKSKEIIEIQAEWKTIGFAPQKMNVKIFERFRAACDAFFTAKGEFFTAMKERFAENIEKKKALIAKAIELQDSTEWKQTADKLIALQKEWKTVGAVPKKQGDQLWAEFQAACNKFFDARNDAHKDQRATEQANLEAKRGIIAELTALLESAAEDMRDQMRALMDKYNAVGHVPFRDKDALYADYHSILDKLHKKLGANATRRRMDNFRQGMKKMAESGAAALDNERTRLLRRADQLKADINTFENNIGFLSASSKKGNSLIDEMNRKVEKLREELKLTRDKIKAIDQENKD